jgi:type I restriction-modification system DNA methylase subunit
MADTNLSSFIWLVADLLRGDYKQTDYAKGEKSFTTHSDIKLTILNISHAHP